MRERRAAANLSDDDLRRLARLLYEEEDRMLPDLESRKWPDLDCGEVAHYENCVKAVIRGLSALQISKHPLASPDGIAKNGIEKLSHC